MRILDTKTGHFVEIDPEERDRDKRKVYAILSHTWDTTKPEQTYEELRTIQKRYPLPSQTPPYNRAGPLKVKSFSPSSSPSSADATSVTSQGPSCQSEPTPSSSQPNRSASATSSLLSDSSSVPPHPPTALVPLTPSEVESLLCAVRIVEQYGLLNPSPSSTPSGTSVPAPDSQSQPLPKCIWEDPELSPKIQEACRIARENSYRYIWIDSCCIDKSSSSELSEAINSMYKWYGLAAVCYAYLADVPPGGGHHDEKSAFRKSRWFQRGWTLQELIAPFSVEFLSKDWSPIGSKHALVDLVESITKIDYKALLHLEPLDTFSIAQRLSWAANRKTTRVEDRAYSLLGIFDINIPTLYGEGDRAFRRLQEQIMQRTPDQSLFAWGDHYPTSQFSQDTEVPNTLKAHTASLLVQDQWSNLFATSPDSFRGCEGVRTTCRDIGQLLSSNGHKIAYTPTPYGISTQFLMVPLTRDLLLRTILHCSEDFQLNTSYSPEGSQWYLLILQCELGERQGYCIGRVCYLIPSEESDINSVYTGYIQITSPRGQMLRWPGLFLLSPKTIKNCRPQPELKTVYIPHPDHDNLSRSSNLQHLDHPTTHWLALSKDEHTITVKFQHTLKYGGEAFIIEAEVKMSGSRVQLDSAPDSDQAEHHTVSWSDAHFPWRAELDHEKVRLSAAGAGTLTVDLGLDFTGHGYYFLRVDVLSDTPPASSAVEPAVDQEEEGERTGKARHLKQSTLTMWFKRRIGWAKVPSAEDRDAVASSDDMEDGDGDGVSA